MGGNWSMRKKRKLSGKSGTKAQEVKAHSHGFKISTSKKQTLPKASYKNQLTISYTGTVKDFKPVNTVMAHSGTKRIRLKGGKVVRHIVRPPSYKLQPGLFVGKLTVEDGLQVKVECLGTKGDLVGKGDANVSAYKRNRMPTRPRPKTGKPQTSDTSDQNTQGQNSG